ncbi:FCD domain-containing protein [Microbacteriaceae bacterium K1510]|nr:FCD domain-containing protein [Microbacteriaceae bacterium K1510]
MSKPATTNAVSVVAMRERPDAYATQSESAYAAIREDILAGRLEPSQKLLLGKLCDQYGVGSSPLREALSRLAGERLVLAQGQRGYWVAPMSEVEFNDITDMRLLLEPEALRRSITHATLEWEGGVAAAFHRLSRIEAALDTDPKGLSRAWEIENRAFHLALIDNCGSPSLLRFVTSIAELSERYRRQSVSLRAVPKETLMLEHKAIFDAAMQRNAGLATELLKVHLKNSANAIAEALFAKAQNTA